MSQRRILHHGPDPDGAPLLLQDRAVAGCWFELHRHGGCGGGELVLRDEFPQREAIEIGDWISCEAAAGERWYLGRVEERRAASPAEVRLRLEGMSVELGEVFPGGFAVEAEGAAPHRYAATDLFPHDPDRSLETVDSVDSVDQLVRLLVEQYVVPATHITFDPLLVEAPLHPAPVTSLKFRGEESVRAVLKDLALRAEADWGVDAEGRFFFRRRRGTVVAVWREGRDLTSLKESRDREHLFNRVLLTGDYVYDQIDAVAHIAQRSYRWRGNYVQPDSRAAYGERRIRLWAPWLRTAEDSLAFVREFFRVYSQPTSRYLVETLPQEVLIAPWEGRIRLEDREGAVLTVAWMESLRVLFDHAARFRLELGPEDPRELWPEPPHDERWELPTNRTPGGRVDVTDRPPVTSEPSSDASSEGSSDASSDNSSDVSSGDRSSDASLSSFGSDDNSGEETSHAATSDSSAAGSSVDTSAGSSEASLSSFGSSDASPSMSDSGATETLRGSGLSSSEASGSSLSTDRSDSGESSSSRSSWSESGASTDGTSASDSSAGSGSAGSGSELQTGSGDSGDSHDSAGTSDDVSTDRGSSSDGWATSSLRLTDSSGDWGMSSDVPGTDASASDSWSSSEAADTDTA